MRGPHLCAGKTVPPVLNEKIVDASVVAHPCVFFNPLLDRIMGVLC